MKANSDHNICLRLDLLRGLRQVAVSNTLVVVFSKFKGPA
jgi:hypothetical protein